ncbi:histidine kinase [Streptomyces sp. NPDC051684]|uniref:histidine kinase n=1 Tax=Streptomyces sp. NPDC051684 TaxID=3365670 RepID=UPI00379FF1F1
MARALLGPGRLDDRVHVLEETRARAVQDSAAPLRRIERDLHDGAQARMVAVAMTLARARERLGRLPGRAGPRALVRSDCQWRGVQRTHGQGTRSSYQRHRGADRRRCRRPDRCRAGAG